MTMWYPTAFSVWGDEERAAIARVIASNQFTQGEEVAAFEAEFAAFHKRKHAIMVNSGSSANLVAVSALCHLGMIKEGGRALVPALAWATTYAPIVQHGLDLVLVDCDDTWNADAFSLRSPGEIGLVVACSILGNPADMAHWASTAGLFDAPLLEDNCESLGACDHRGNLTGTAGFMSTFSLFWSHQLSAIEGGVILTDDLEAASVCRMLRAHGWTRDIDPAVKWSEGGALLAFEREYDFLCFGYNVRGLELHAAIAREQLKKLPGFIAKRQRNADLFAQALFNSGLPITLPTYTGQNSPFGLHFTLNVPGQRNRLAAALRASGIDCRLPTGGSFTKHAYGARWRDQPTPKADHIHENGMFLGNGPLELWEKIDRAVQVMRETLR